MNRHICYKFSKKIVKTRKRIGPFIKNGTNSKISFEKHHSLPAISNNNFSFLDFLKIPNGESGEKMDLENQSKDQFYSSKNSIELLEFKLIEILDMLIDETQKPFVFKKKLMEWTILFLENENHIQQMFESKIGYNLKLVTEQIQQISKKRKEFEFLQSICFDLLNKIQSKLFFNFFRTNNIQISKSEYDIISIPCKKVFNCTSFDENHDNKHQIFNKNSNLSTKESFEIENKSN